VIVVEDCSRLWGEQAEQWRAIKELPTSASKVVGHGIATAYRQRLLLSQSRFCSAMPALGLKHRFTRPYTPRTNGKADRFIQTALREWAYARAYHRSHQRISELLALPGWLQLASPSRQPGRPTARIHTWTHEEQPHETSQLVVSVSRPSALRRPGTRSRPGSCRRAAWRPADPDTRRSAGTAQGSVPKRTARARAPCDRPSTVCTCP
jgi:hypothetical protein